MKTKAAVAWKAGQPLTIEEIDLTGPKSGEVLVEIKATGICHTDYYTLSGADPEGLFPAILGHEGAGVVVDVGPNVKSLRKGDHVIPLYTPECRECKFCLSKNQFVSSHPQHPRQRSDARQLIAVFTEWQTLVSLHGHINLLQLHCGPRNRVGKNSPRCTVR